MARPRRHRVFVPEIVDRPRALVRAGSARFSRADALQFISDAARFLGVLSEVLTAGVAALEREPAPRRARRAKGVR